MWTGLVVSMIVGLPIVNVYDLALICSHGVLKNKRSFLPVVQNRSIALLPMLPQILFGSLHYALKSVLRSPLRPNYGAITQMQWC